MASHQIIVQVVFFKNQFHNLPGIFWSNIGIWWYLYDFRVWVEKTHHSTSAKNLWISLLHRGPRPDHSKARSNLGIAGDTTVTENHGHNMSHVSLRGEISTKCFDCFFLLQNGLWRVKRNGLPNIHRCFVRCEICWQIVCGGPSRATCTGSSRVEQEKCPWLQTDFWNELGIMQSILAILVSLIFVCLYTLEMDYVYVFFKVSPDLCPSAWVIYQVIGWSNFNRLWWNGTVSAD